MTWNDLSVFDFQQLARLRSELDTLDDVTVAVRTVAACYRKTEAQVDSMPVAAFQEALAACSFVHEQPPAFEPVKYVTIAGTRYVFQYDARKIRAARYMEAKTFGAEDIAANVHRIAASMVQPQYKTWRGWRDVPYDAARHEQYADDLQQAPFPAVYGAVVFFWKVFVDLMPALSDFLTKDLTTTERTALHETLTRFSIATGG